MTALLRTLAILGDTSRSQAYAQRLATIDGLDVHVLHYGGDLLDRPGRGRLTPHPALPGLPTLDPSQSIDQIASRAGWTTTALPHADLSDPGLHAAVHERQGWADVAAFSGYGGEMVGRDLLRIGIPFVHVHAGRLPEFRGSTTVYYSLLAEGTCEVSAILMTPELDAGRVVGRRQFAAPPAGTDLDHGFDPSMRASLLAEVLQHRAASGQWPMDIEQPEGGTDWYVMHPVLRHVVRLGLPGGSGADGLPHIADQGPK